MGKPTQHDYTKQCWGHQLVQVSQNKNGTLNMTGHGTGIKKNDTLLLKMNSGRIGQLKVRAVSYLQDPADMWTMTAKLEGYLDTPATTPEPQSGEPHAA